MKPFLILSSLILAATALSSPALAEQVQLDRYPWLKTWSGPTPPMIPLSDRFAPPEGYRRPYKDDLSRWMRGLPVRTDRSWVKAYNGDRLWRPSAAVIALDVSPKNLQQCADTAYRLHGEYLWATGQARGARYHFTSGDVTTYAAWLKGERFKAKGRGIQRVRGASRPHSHGTYRRWLDHLFIYAGTRSIERDSVAVDRYEAARPGDVFVQGGSPGHAVIIMDIVTAPGRPTLALLGQGFMPAEDLHILEAPWAAEGVWFTLSESLLTPSWPKAFQLDDLRRFKIP